MQLFRTASHSLAMYHACSCRAVGIVHETRAPRCAVCLQPGLILQNWHRGKLQVIAQRSGALTRMQTVARSKLTCTLQNGAVLSHAQILFAACSARRLCRSNSHTNGKMSSIMQKSGTATPMDQVRNRVPRSLAHRSSALPRCFGPDAGSLNSGVPGMVPATEL